jgi:hypothetical protein
MGFNRCAALVQPLVVPFHCRPYPETDLQLQWCKITSSRLTSFYFIFSVLHFAIQLSFQIRAYTVNAAAHQIITNIVHDAGTVNASLPFLKSSRLYLCSWVPSNLNTDVADCPIIWNADDEDASHSNAASFEPTVTATSSSYTPAPTPTVFVPPKPNPLDEVISALRATHSRRAITYEKV